MLRTFLSESVTRTAFSPLSMHFLAQSPPTLGAHFASVIQPATVVLSAAKEKPTRKATTTKIKPNLFIVNSSILISAKGAQSARERHSTIRLFPSRRESILLVGSRLGRRQGVHHLSRPSIAELLAGFLLNGLRLGFQGFDGLLAARTLLLQRLNFVFEFLRVSHLAMKRQKSVDAKDCAVADETHQGNHRDCRQLVAHAVDPSPSARLLLLHS